MTLTDLKTVKENNIPIKMAIMNNDAPDDGNNLGKIVL